MPTLFSESLYKGRAFRLNSFIKLLQRKEGSKPAFFSGKVWWWWWVVGGGRCILLCLLPHLFFGIWFGCFCLLHNSWAASKEEPCPSMLGSKHVVSVALSSTRIHTLSHTSNSMGDVFRCFVRSEEMKAHH